MSALFFDIDGTILSEITHKIPESALEALHKAQENGHKTFINTGRTICSVPPMIKRISFDGFLCGCGTHLIYGEDVFNHIDRLGGVYECVQKEYSKATAIEYIQKELHLADDEIYAFGDSSNDLDMIKAAGHGVLTTDGGDS